VFRAHTAIDTSSGNKQAQKSFETRRLGIFSRAKKVQKVATLGRK
jgi:hypothetical protein